jgi:long-chain fatty acid transport protein
MKILKAPAIFFAMVPGGLTAAGYYLPNQDAYATSKGNAWVATADGAAAVFYNPAGLTQLNQPEAQAGLHAIVLDTTHEAGGVTTENNQELQVVPNLYYAQPVNDKLSVGFGLNSPFGLGNDWGRNTPFSTVITEARLMYISATSAVAYKVTDQISLGASVSVNYADLLLEQGLGLPNSFMQFSGTDYGFSAGVGALWQPHEQHSFGLTYVTESTFDLDGKTISSIPTVIPDDTNASLDFMAPARAAAGYSYRPAPGWNLEANIEWLNYDELNDLTLQSNTVGGTRAVPFHWESSFIYEVGASYTTPEGYIFAIGYDFNESSQPDANYNPGVADSDLHWLNLGFGKKTDRYSWMLGYQFGYSNRDVDGAVGGSAPANGRYEIRHNTLIFSWNQKF